MILFTILAIILVILTLLAVLALSLGGIIGVVLFGDLIVCIVLIVWLMKRLHKKK